MNGHINGNSSSEVKKKKFRFNFIDVALILILVAIISMLISFFLPMSWFGSFTKTQEKDIQYTIEFIGVDEEFIEKIKEGDCVIDSVTKATIGNVLSVNQDTKYTEYKLIESTKHNENGEPENIQIFGPVDYQDKYNLLVTVNVRADYVEGDGYSVNSTRIAVGEKMSIKFPNFACEGYCIGITQN